MNPYKVRMRCLELARRDTYDQIALLREALVLETYVHLGFNSAVDVASGQIMDTLRNAAPQPEQPPPPAEDPEPASAVDRYIDAIEAAAAKPADGPTQDGFPVSRLH